MRNPWWVAAVKGMVAVIEPALEGGCAYTGSRSIFSSNDGGQ